jgi:hypothetical protein
LKPDHYEDLRPWGDVFGPFAIRISDCEGDTHAGRYVGDEDSGRERAAEKALAASRGQWKEGDPTLRCGMRGQGVLRVDTEYIEYGDYQLVTRAPDPACERSGEALEMTGGPPCKAKVGGCASSFVCHDESNWTRIDDELIPVKSRCTCV